MSTTINHPPGLVSALLGAAADNLHERLELEAETVSEEVRRDDEWMQVTGEQVRFLRDVALQAAKQAPTAETPT